MLIKKIKEDKKLNQSKLAQKLGVDQSTLSKIESGKLKIPMVVAFNLHKKFKVPYEKIFKEYEKACKASK